MKNKSIEITVPRGFIPREYQREFMAKLDGENLNRIILRWHRRCGKDVSCLAYMFKEMIATPGQYFYFLPEYQQARKVIWEGAWDRGKKRMLEMMPKALISRLNNQEMVMETINGSLFRCVGSNNIDSIVGTNPRGIVFSEFALQDPKGWELMRPVLAENQGWAIFNSTPRGRNHFYELEMNVRGNPKWYISVRQTLWPEEPNFTGEVHMDAIEDDRASGMPEEEIEQEYGVSYAAGVRGTFYSAHIEKAREQGRIGDFPYDDHGYVNTFWDLGRADDTVIWFAQYKNGRITFIDYHEECGKDIAHYVDILLKKGYRYREHFLPHDANHGSIQTRFSTADIFREVCKQAGISDRTTVAPKMPVMDGINAVRSRFGRYYFNEGLCVKGIEKLSLYHRRYDSKRRTFIKEPVHDWTSHAADAIRTEAVCAGISDRFFGGEPRQKPELLTDFNIF